MQIITIKRIILKTEKHWTKETKHKYSINEQQSKNGERKWTER